MTLKLKLIKTKHAILSITCLIWKCFMCPVCFFVKFWWEGIFCDAWSWTFCITPCQFSEKYYSCSLFSLHRDTLELKIGLNFSLDYMTQGIRGDIKHRIQLCLCFVNNWIYLIRYSDISGIFDQVILKCSLKRNWRRK